MWRIKNDLAIRKTNTMNAGFTKKNVQFDQVVNNDLVDAFRYFYIQIRQSLEVMELHGREPY